MAPFSCYSKLCDRSSYHIMRQRQGQRLSRESVTKLRLYIEGLDPDAGHEALRYSRVGCCC